MVSQRFDSADRNKNIFMAKIINKNMQDDDENLSYTSIFGKFIIAILTGSVLIWIIWALCSCNPVKQYQKFEAKAAAAIPNDKYLLSVAEPIVLKNHPCDSLPKIGKPDTVTSVQFDTSYQYLTVHDTIVKMQVVAKIQTNTIHQIDTLYDNRKIVALHDELKSLSDTVSARNNSIAVLNSNNAQLTKSNKTKLWWLIGIGVAVVGLGAWKVYSLFSGKAVTGAVQKLI